MFPDRPNANRDRDTPITVIVIDAIAFSARKNVKATPKNATKRYNKAYRLLKEGDFQWL
ncbi:MAG: hypothetical protein AAGA60_28620 [Cyanobacteria bacterium P01_E01_bin.42]